ncbi:hypothetical protein Tco_0766268 [Tanacetum coccineum]
MLKVSIDNGPYQFKPEITIKDTDGITDIRCPQKIEDLAGQDKLRYDSDIKVVNILLLGFPVDIYTLINHYQTGKEIRDRIKELMEGIYMTKQERESMLYDEFDKFTYEPGESIYSYYLRYVKLINDMKMIPMSMSNMQINIKFMNHLQPEWSRFVTTAKQARNLHSHIAKQCTAKKRVKDSEWFKDKMLLAQAQEEGVVLNEEQQDILADNCDDDATANAIFMVNLSPVGSLNNDTVEPRYDSNILSEVPHYDTYHDSDMLNSNIQELGYIENIVSNNESYDELTSNSNVISYTDYMLTIGNDKDNYVPPPVQKNDMMLSVIEQMKSQVEKYNKISENNKLRAQLKGKFSEPQMNQNSTSVNTKLSKPPTSGTKLYSVTPLPKSKIESEPINAYFKNNIAMHRDYLKVTKEHVATLQELLEEAKALKPLD